jgi:hypothetical protein
MYAFKLTVNSIGAGFALSAELASRLILELQ